MRRCSRWNAATKPAPQPDYFAANIPAMVLISLRAYLGSPALIELPELNDDWPIRTCAGTRFRKTGTFSKPRFSSSTLALIASDMKAVTTVLLGSAGCRLEDGEKLAEFHDLIDVEDVLLEHAGNGRIEPGQFLQSGLVGDIGSRQRRQLALKVDVVGDFFGVRVIC